MALAWLLALSALAPAALLFGEPGFIDANYYFHVGVNLAAGRGFTEDFIWSYLVEPEALTHPSNLYWMPLVSIVIAPSLAIFGDSFRAAQFPLVMLAATVPAATAVVARSYLGDWRRSLSAAAIVLFSGYYLVYWTAIDAFALYALTAGGSFLATSALLKGPMRMEGRTGWLAGALGVCCGLAHLARADGPLLLGTNLLLLLLHAGSSGRNGAARGWFLATLGATAAGYLLVMGPWFLRNYSIAGSPLPGGGLQTMFLREYNEIFAYGVRFDLAHYLDQDLRDLLAGKGAAAIRNLGVLFGLQYWLVPFAVAGWRAALSGPGRALFLPPLVYGIALYGVMTLVFTFPSMRGTMLHSSVALLPWLAVAAVDGIGIAVRWTAARLSHWKPEQATRNFTGIFLAFSVIASFYALVDQARVWPRQVDAYRALAPALLERAPDAVPMVLNAPGWWYATGRPAMQTPSNGPDAALAAATRYGATHLVMEPAHPSGWERFAADPQADGRFELWFESEGYVVYGLSR